MGAAMGENPDILEEVCRWVMEVAKKPVWAKMTPNVTHIDLRHEEMLMLCSDGVHKFVHPFDMARLLRNGPGSLARR